MSQPTQAASGGATEGSVGRVTMSDHTRVVKVIGLYGISGSGKTTLLDDLKHDLDSERFSFYEGSEVIAKMLPGGLEAFQKLDKQAKTHLRQLAIEDIYKDCHENGRTAIITGHFMFWREHDMLGDVACTESDLATYTHIVYLNISPEIIEQRCSNDVAKQRHPLSISHLSRWQEAERAGLRSLCRERGILFSVVDANQIAQRAVQSLVRDFDLHDESYNNTCTEHELDQIVSSNLSKAETVLVIDGDKTITSQDTGTLFWEKVLANRGCGEEIPPLKALFSGPLGYSYAAFRQATLLYEEAARDEMYEHICQQVASATLIHPEFLSLLQLVAELASVGAILVSCGLRRVWEIVLEKANLVNTVGIIAGGRIADGLVVTAATKAMVVSRLQTRHQQKVWAFGDSPLDLEMLKAADQAIVVVTGQHTRSKSMDSALSNAIDEGLQALQVVLPSTTPPRLDTMRLPTIDITKVDFINSLLHRPKHTGELSIFIATEAASNLLATSMRDAAKFGPDLRKAHKNAGWYLAHEHLSRIIGLEACAISHVLGHPTSGSRLCKETQTTILALMRGGEPMASGVSKAFPRAMYVHMKEPHELKQHHVQDQAQVVLVDSVVNTGKSVIECVQAIRHLNNDIRVIIVAGVVQAQCLHKSSVMYKALSAYGRIDIVALRVSETKFTGSGTTDTGNRLFNTTHLL